MANRKEEAQANKVDQAVERIQHSYPKEIAITVRTTNCTKVRKGGFHSLLHVRKQEEAHHCILGEMAQRKRARKANHYLILPTHISESS